MINKEVPCTKPEQKETVPNTVKSIKGYRNSADSQYLHICKDVLEDGYYAQNRTGIATVKLPHRQMQFDLSREFPILTTKKVAFKTAVKEMLWIYQKQSNDVKVLQEMNVHVWDQWAATYEEAEKMGIPVGSIGDAYGEQIRKYDQIDNLIHSLKTDPQDRRMILNLWNNADLHKMKLQPCCLMTLWDVTDGRLNCMLVQRSADLPLGVPFNMTQFAVLQCVIAHVTGLKVGLFTHFMNNAHIYENQFTKMKEQLEIFRNKGAMLQPKLWINPEKRDFYEITADDIRLDNYINHGSIDFPEPAV